MLEIDERILADGTVDRPLDPAGAVAAARRAMDDGAASVAVCFLHAWRNPAHEAQAGQAIRAALPELDLVLSHEVWPQQSEYERASATLLNAYARRALPGYLGEIEAFLAREFPRARLLVTKSNGGVTAAAEATRMPIHTLLSGPAAGVTAAAVLGRALGETNVLSMDMGGTSTDISTIRDGTATVSHQGRVGDFPLMLPVTAIESIGAGGGALATMDGTVLKVGPRSAVAAPGPACYGRGGTAAAVSDAYPGTESGRNSPFRAAGCNSANGRPEAWAANTFAGSKNVPIGFVRKSSEQLAAAVVVVIAPFLSRSGANHRPAGGRGRHSPGHRCPCTACSPCSC